ncbi:hypothetical protein CORC01_04517 [Colletotrichum orchidophilum]|uniref:Uncharacterized protein n=1 Tax=Colletotrichum orchidophilum TaxID=1209926 RepID=A0A1G4BFE5_9PEZI|nr:uncharacterized protein CORC01_04517 [Colletotrichum orchidophilum]OHF00109.1 hypothetical protein CORC01_04517 [Colletotrichum orchidophilum]
MAQNHFSNQNCSVREIPAPFLQSADGGRLWVVEIPRASLGCPPQFEVVKLLDWLPHPLSRLSQLTITSRTLGSQRDDESPESEEKQVHLPQNNCNGILLILIPLAGQGSNGKLPDVGARQPLCLRMCLSLCLSDSSLVLASDPFP